MNQTKKNKMIAVLIFGLCLLWGGTLTVCAKEYKPSEIKTGTVLKGGDKIVNSGKGASGVWLSYNRSSEDDSA